LVKNRKFKVDTKDKRQENGTKKNSEEKAPVTEAVAENEEHQIAEIDTNEKNDSGEESPWLEGGAEAEIADLKDKLLRALADNENTIRRAKREREDTAKYAAANFARDMLTVADNLHRALDAAPESLSEGDDQTKAFMEGIDLTSRELLSVLERHGIKKISPVGEKFNHDQHEALFEVPTSDMEPGMVVQVIEDGFIIHDRLLRAAKVGVSKTISVPETNDDSEVDDSEVNEKS
jgi:molecular chaperone GrpE